MNLQNKCYTTHLYDSAQNESKYTGRSKKEFDKSIQRVIESIRETSSELLPEEEECDYNYLVRLFSDAVNESRLEQQSCFTWARKHLKSIDIDLPSAKIEAKVSRVISITHFQTEHKMEETETFVSLVGKEKEALKEPEEDQEGKKLEKVIVSYETNRDTKTEAWKQIKSSLTINDIGLKAGLGLSVVGGAGMWGGVGIGITAGCGAVVAAPVVLPILAVGGVVFTVGGAVSIAVSAHKLKKAQNVKNAEELLTARELQEYEKVREKKQSVQKDVETVLQKVEEKSESVPKIEEKLHPINSRSDRGGGITGHSGREKERCVIC